MRARGNTEIGLKVMQDFVDRTKDVAVVEKRPSLEGRHMIMILAPKAEKATFAEKKARKANEAAGEKAPEAQE